jgi:transposase
VHVTAGNEQDRHQVDALAAQVQDVTGDAVAITSVDQAYTGDQATQDAEAHPMHLEVVKRPEARKGFVLLPRRWGVERSFAWTGRCRRLPRDDERLAHTLASMHVVAFGTLLLKRVVELIV